jgi:hypothetical protein
MKTFSVKSRPNDALRRSHDGVKVAPILNKKSLAAFPTRHPLVQPKLRIGQPNDKYEQEADRVADRVMKMQEPNGSLGERPTGSQLVQRESTCHECKNESESIRAKPAANTTPILTTGLQGQVQSLKGGGQPLPRSIRNFFEPRFDRDFSQVRVHTSGKAVEAAESVNARAFTLGKNVVFGVGQYTPETSGGKRLLAHELTHVVQDKNILQRDPDPNDTPWQKLPPDLRKVYRKSYEDKKLKKWIFGYKGKNASENYNNLYKYGPNYTKALLRVYNRMKHAGLWGEIKYLTNISGPAKPKGKTIIRTPTIDFILKNSTRFISLLSSSKFCRDTRLSGYMKNIFTGSRKIPLMKWREVVVPGTPGLHVSLNDAHVDDIAPVAGRMKNGDCRDAAHLALTHASVDLWKSRYFTLYPRVMLYPGEEPRPGQVVNIISFPLCKLLRYKCK